DPAPLARGESRARACAEAIAHAAGALAAEIAVGPVVLPKLAVMRAREVARRREAPVLVHNQRPQLGVDAGGRDGARVPAVPLLVQRVAHGAHVGVPVRRRMAGAALLDRAPLRRG